MELGDLVLYITIGIVNIAIALFLIITYYLNKKNFPYSNVSSLWIILFLIGK